jgi:diguanylate cyclase (GGDEF)-like protein
MAKPVANIQDQLKALRDAYAQQLPERIQQLENTCNRLLEHPEDVEAFKSLIQQAHGLAGSGATFGFSALSDTARTLEIYLKSLGESLTGLSDVQREQVSAMLAAVKRGASRSDQAGADHLRVYVPSVESPLYRRDTRLIYLLEGEPHVARNLALQISYFGYTVRTVNNLEELKEAVRDETPFAIIMHMGFLEHSQGGSETIAQIQDGFQEGIQEGIQAGRKTRIPIIFISARGDLVTRLQAVRAGGEAYFTKPVDIGSLMDRLDRLTARGTADPIRILIVEDEPAPAAYYAAVLEQAGMVTEVINSPLEVMRPLIEFKPDLILLDMYMPYCTGMELAQVIRQMDLRPSLPIVFVSVEPSLDEQVGAALDWGPLDVLTKPIRPEQLVSTITRHVQRTRMLCPLLERDNLTGLLNHTKTWEQLDLAVARAIRQSARLAFAVVDIDGLGSINDVYGHRAGDHVTEHLARLIQKRLRRIDVVGRYGGKQFALILLDADATSATGVIDEIRTDFARTPQWSGPIKFYTTFSCGIAPFPEYRDALMLDEAADKALQKAKSLGRNQVVLAGR